LQACKEAGLHVILATNDKNKDEQWPRESIDEFFHMPDLGKRPDIIHAVAYLARSRQIDLITALDDFDVETAAHLREHFRLPGMGDSLARNFRDRPGPLDLDEPSLRPRRESAVRRDRR